MKEDIFGGYGIEVKLENEESFLKIKENLLIFQLVINHLDVY